MTPTPKTLFFAPFMQLPDGERVIFYTAEFSEQHDALLDFLRNEYISYHHYARAFCKAKWEYIELWHGTSEQNSDNFGHDNFAGIYCMGTLSALPDAATAKALYEKYREFILPLVEVAQNQ